LKRIVAAMFFLKVRPRKKPKKISVDRTELEAIQQGMETSITREELREYLDKIEKDKEKKRIWDNLSARKKIKVLKYALERKQKSGKKQ